ncbi:MAG: 6-pyruvoyl-tetrahydropterin synthase-related protein [Chloroflexota bacterium]|nr:6-pyruvoyl-tetrahydropterin synthase-related protein [Chloroflexota bacterium]
MKESASLTRDGVWLGHDHIQIPLARMGLWGRVDSYAFLALMLTVFAWAPLLSPNYFMGAHDAHPSLFFPIQFDRGIQDGYWLPRWGPDIAHGYGYPILVFYAPLSFYIWESFHLTPLFGVVASTKATFVVGFLLGAAGVYAYAREVWGRQVALLASLVYTYLPYHLLDIYVRAALAEFMAMALLPWIALAFRRLVRHPSLLTVAGAAGSYGALLWTHNITALTFTPLLSALILFELALVGYQSGNWHAFLGRPLFRRVLPVSGSIALAVAIGTAVWLPSLAEQDYIEMEQWALQTYQYRDHFVYPSQLLSPFWGFGYSVPGPGDGMSFQLGLAALMLAGLALYHLLTTNDHHPKAATIPQSAFRLPQSNHFATSRNPALTIFYAISLLILVALMLPPAVAVWNIAPLSTLVQFPWRLLAVAALPLSLLAGGAALFLAPRGGVMPGLAVAVLLVLATTVDYTQPEFTPPNPRDETQQTWRDYERKYPDMVGMVAQTQEQPVSSPMLAALEANETPQRFEALTQGVTVTQLHEAGGSASAQIEASEPATIRYLTYYYPGWRATLDGKVVEIRQDDGPLGLMVVDVPEGKHVLAFRFSDPPLRRTANLISLGSLLILMTLVLLGSWKRGTAA